MLGKCQHGHSAKNEAKNKCFSAKVNTGEACCAQVSNKDEHI